MFLVRWDPIGTVRASARPRCRSAAPLPRFGAHGRPRRWILHPVAGRKRPSLARLSAWRRPTAPQRQRGACSCDRRGEACSHGPGQDERRTPTWGNGAGTSRSRRFASTGGPERWRRTGIRGSTAEYRESWARISHGKGSVTLEVCFARRATARRSASAMSNTGSVAPCRR
jgi:hypothetical protein